MKTALITGGTDGIGKATARRLVQDGWNVVVTGRSRERCDAVVGELSALEGAGRVSALVGDLRLMADVARLAAEFRAAHAQLDVLVLNANAISQERVVTAEGFESNLAVGYLGRVLLFWSLEDLLRSTPGGQALTVVGLNLERLDFDDVGHEKAFSDMKALGRWQWAMQVFSRELARRGGPPMNVFMPGLVKTKILANEPQPMRAVVQLAQLFVGISVEKSAGEVASALAEVSARGLRDTYFARAKARGTRALKDQPGDGERLWALTEQLLGRWRQS